MKKRKTRIFRKSPGYLPYWKNRTTNNPSMKLMRRCRPIGPPAWKSVVPPETFIHTIMEKVRKTEAEWRAMLDPMEYRVTREAATARAFSGRYWDHHEHGINTCDSKNTPQNETETKNKTGSSRPSKNKPLNPDNVAERIDRSHGM